MTTATKSRKATVTKTVHVLARVQFKSDSRKVVYVVRSSKGDTTYQTSFFDGKATSCTCASRKPCYHMTQLEAREAERTPSLEYRVVRATPEYFSVEQRVRGTYTWHIVRGVPCMHEDACHAYIAGSEQERAAIVAAFEKQCEAAWNERKAEEARELEALMAASDDEDADDEYEAWKREHGLDQLLGREEYASYFDVHGYEL